MNNSHRQSVLIINTSVELVEILEYVLKEAKFKVRSLYTTQIKSGEIDLEKVLASYSPDAIIYDIAIPYQENYDLYQKVAQGEKAQKIPFVLTTTNKYVLDKLVGKNDACEIVGKPFDLEELLSAVRRVIKQADEYS